MVEAGVAQKPVKRFAKQIDYLISVWYEFSKGIFPNRLQQSFILGSSHQKESYCYNTCGGFILSGIADYVSLQFYFRMSSFAGVFTFFVCIYFTGPSFDDCFRAYFLESLSTKEEFNFSSVFQFSTYFTKLKLRSNCLAVSQ